MAAGGHDQRFCPRRRLGVRLRIRRDRRRRRLRIRDSLELARQDWFGSAAFDRPEDHWPRRWAEAYLQFAATEERAWLRSMGHHVFPVVGWAERGDGRAEGHGNSVPRFHVTWGTGPGIVESFGRRLREHEAADRIRMRTRRSVEELIVEGGRVAGVRGSVLAPDATGRGIASTREVVGHFEERAAAVVVTTGGIGGNPELVRAVWPERLGEMPRDVVLGVPASVDGSGLLAAERAGGRWINRDRMWHCTEGLRNWDPVWEGHGIRILPGPSSLWLDADGNRLPAPCYPGFDTMSTLAELRRRGSDHSWFVLTRAVAAKEFPLSGSEQNPDLTGRSWRQVLGRIGPSVPGPVQAFLDHGEDFVQADDVATLAARMNALGGEGRIDVGAHEALLRAHDAEIDNPYSKHAQVTALRAARRFVGDRLVRTAAPHRFLDPAAGGLIAVRLHTLLRKTLGGLETDLGGREQSPDGGPVPGLYAAGEVAGFGGGGMHGFNALEGTFLGRCLFSGRETGRGRSSPTCGDAACRRRSPSAAVGEDRGEVLVPAPGLLLRLEGIEGGAQRREVAIGRVEHEAGVLGDRVDREVAALGVALAAHERALHARDEREAREVEHREDLVVGEAARLPEVEGLPQALRADGEREVRQELARRGLRGRVHAAQAIGVGPRRHEVLDPRAEIVVRRADVHAELPRARRSERADHGHRDVGGHGLRERLGVGGGDGARVGPRHAVGDEARLDDRLAHGVGAEEARDDDVGAVDRPGGRVGHAGAGFGEALRLRARAVPDGELVVGQEVQGELGAHAPGAEECDSHALQCAPRRPRGGGRRP
ncbi:hypothetical protein GCM10027268_13770 [Brachybacterium huguangmaarense]